jgi:hypothetical protein
LAAHVNAYGKVWSDTRYTNQAAIVLMIVQTAIGTYPQLNQILPQISPGSPFWEQGEAFRQSSAESSKASGKADTIGLLSVVLAPLAIWAFAPAAGAGVIAAETGVATVQGVELAALVEAGTVGAEGAFLEAAALTGSSVSYATGTGAILSAVTPAGETVLFDTAIDPFTQFGQMPIDSVNMPEESLQTPNQTPQTQQAPQSSELSKPVTEYAKKLIAGEAMKLLTGGKQSPGATAQASANQELAPGTETGDITPLVALAMVAGAFVLRKGRKRP